MLMRLLVAISACGLGSTLLTEPAAAAPIAPPRAATLAVTPADPIAGESFIVRGTVPGNVARTVRLMKLNGKRWVRVASTRSTATGAFAIRATATTKTTYRATGPKLKVKGRKLAAFTGPSKAVVPRSQGAGLTMPDTARVGADLAPYGTFTPARPGRRATLQASVNGRWVTAASAVQDATGRATFALTPTATGKVSYRVAGAAASGAPAVFSAPRQLNVTPGELGPKPPATVLTPEQAGAVTSVDLSSGVVRLASRPAGLTFASGDFLVVPPVSGALSGALRRIVGVEPEGSGLLLRTEPAELTQVAPRGPSNDVAFTPAGPLEFTPEAGVSVAGSGTSKAAVPKTFAVTATVAGKALELEVNRQLTWKPTPEVTAEVKANGTIKVTPEVSLTLDLAPNGVLEGYRLAGGLTWDVGLSAEASVSGKWSGDSTRELPLGKLRRPFVGMLGPVPVYVELSGNLILEYSVTGEVKLKFEQTYQGSSMAGVRNTSGTDLSPEPFTETAEGVGTLAEATAQGKAEGFAGARLELMLYSTAGPYLKVGVGAQATVEYQDNRWKCHFEVGPAGEVGLRTSDALNALTGKTWDPLSYQVPFTPWISSNACPLPPDTQLITKRPDGTPVGGYGHATSTDGRYVAFISHSDELAGEQSDSYQQFLFDRTTNKTTLVSARGDGGPLKTDSIFGSMSHDGRFLVYLIHRPGEGFVARLWDRETKLTKDLPEPYGVLSPTGRYYAYRTDRPIGDGSYNTVSILDRETGTTALVSDLGYDGKQVNAWVFPTSISTDGRYVVMGSDATNLTPGVSGWSPDSYVWDRTTDAITRLGTTGVDPPGVAMSRAQVTPDLRYVLFQTDQRLLPADESDRTDVYWWDRISGERKLVTTFEDRTWYYPDAAPLLSSDGRSAAYTMLFRDISRDIHDEHELYTWSATTEQSRLVKTTRSKWDDYEGGSLAMIGLSYGGRYLTYSDSTLLLPGVLNETRGNVLVWDRELAQD